jgi:hypothetical protein
VNANPALRHGPPALRASAARYSPAGHPSVRPVNPVTSASENPTPVASSSALASRWSIASSATASKQSRLPSSSTWSRTGVTGWVIAEAAATNRGTVVATTETPGEARAWNTPGSIGSTRSSATAR